MRLNNLLKVWIYGFNSILLSKYTHKYTHKIIIKKLFYSLLCLDFFASQYFF